MTDGGRLPDIILLTQGYYPRGTHVVALSLQSMSQYIITTYGSSTMFDDRCTTLF